MLTHLLFSISALIFILIFIITYFTYKKNIGSIRSKLYVCLIFFALSLIVIEILEGITYVYNVSIIFSLMWKLHSIIVILFIATFFYYLLVSIETSITSIDNLLFDTKNILSVRNLFTIIFFVLTILSTIYIKTYQTNLTVFYFYTRQSRNFLLVIYAIYILYNFYIIYLKMQKNSFERNDYIIIIGSFILLIAALFFENNNPEISIYSTIFTLILVLIYYFKENEDLLIIEELEKTQYTLYNSNNAYLYYLHDIINDLEHPLNTFNIINRELQNSVALTDEKLNEDLNSLNHISSNLISIVNSQNANRIQPYRIDELVKVISEIIKPYIVQKQIKFTYNIDQNMPSVLLGDSLSIQRIITNLLLNAVENTEIGKVILTINGEKRRDVEIINLKITDTGKGIKSEDFNRVFMPDFNSNLASTKQFIDSMGGIISFESYYGSGTTFSVSISQNISNEAPISQVPLSANDINVKNCINKRVLILDNEAYSSKKLENILKKYYFSTRCIQKGLDAINIIKGGEEYDLIIVTENVNDIDFIEIGKILKQLSKYLKVPPLVALTVNNNKYYIERVYDEYLLKPLDLKKLNEIIDRRCV